MIFLKIKISDNFIVMMRGFIKKVVFGFFFLFFVVQTAYAAEKTGVITDTLLTPVNYYNAYYRTPEFFAQDIRLQLMKKGIDVVAVDEAKAALKKAGITQRDLENLTALQQGYGVEYSTLKKIAKNTGINKIVLVTMGMDIQRDFLKNTLWNIMNIPGQDVVNPTHRVSVFVTFVDIDKEVVLWESIYAKNIRNNKMKNLDTTISSNYEGMLRLKEYSKYISPDIAYNVKMKMLNANYIEPPAEINVSNVKQYVKDKHNIGVKKELSEIDRQKWDTDKLAADTKSNIKTTANKVKDDTISLKDRIKNAFNSLKSKFSKNKNSAQTL